MNNTVQDTRQGVEGSQRLQNRKKLDVFKALNDTDSRCYERSLQQHSWNTAGKMDSFVMMDYICISFQMTGYQEDLIMFTLINLSQSFDAECSHGVL